MEGEAQPVEANGWDKWQNLVLAKLEELTSAVVELRHDVSDLRVVSTKCSQCQNAEKISAIREEMREVKVRNGLAAALISAIVAAIGAFVAWSMKR